MMYTQISYVVKCQINVAGFDSNDGSGEFLWSTGDTDTGEDGTDKFSANSKGPIQSMDMLGYSVSTRRSLARIASLLGDAAGKADWETKAAAVAATLEATLWRAEEKACFDKDVAGAWVTTLVHNNLRMMWHEAFSQTMADQFISAHLMVSARKPPVSPPPLVCVDPSKGIILTSRLCVCAAPTESQRVLTSPKELSGGILPIS